VDGRAIPPDERFVAEMFDGIATRYDRANRVLSLGLDERWRRATARALHSPPGVRLLDIGCGTGRLTALVAKEAGAAVGVDVSGGMLREARERGVRLMVQASALRLPFPDGAFGGVASAFVLRNLEDLQGAFGEMARVLAPGGSLALADITEPRNRLWRRLFDAYFLVAAPALGRVLGTRDAYRYLSRSLPQLPPPGEVRTMIARAGFARAEERSLFPGMITLWTAIRGRQPETHEG